MMAGPSVLESTAPGLPDYAAGIAGSGAAVDATVLAGRLAFLWFGPSDSAGAAAASATALQCAAKTADFVGAEAHLEHFANFIKRPHRPSLIYLYALPL